MADIWVISDTHFGHENILKFRDSKGNLIRGSKFDTVAEMDEYMVEQWNAKVMPGDKVYHLGDVFFGSKDRFERLWGKLHGKKRLILGNHDDAKSLTKHFQKVMLWRMFPEWGIVLSHVPLHESQMVRYGHVSGKETRLCNVHGHIHQNESPSLRHFNVSVEKTGYGPVNIEELRQKARNVMARETEPQDALVALLKKIKDTSTVFEALESTPHELGEYYRDFDPLANATDTDLLEELRTRNLDMTFTDEDLDMLENLLAGAKLGSQEYNLRMKIISERQF